MSSIIKKDVVILGGGITGLWLVNLLRLKGYDVLLIEKNTIGAGQTLASQGMIHGGIKYTLSGTLTGASESIAGMPARWRDCLNGTGDLDLSGVRTLSNDYFLFSDGRLSSKITAFFGSKAIESRVSPVDSGSAPKIFQDPEFKGLLYKLEDIVVDTRSLLEQLVENAKGAILTAEPDIENDDNRIRAIGLPDGRRITAQHYIFAAGKGNGELCRSLGLPVTMQLRPLNQVVVTGDLPELFAHAVTLRSGDKPRLTITTHSNNEGETCWYLGGDLAETGVRRNDDEQLAYARKELAEVFPWLSFESCTFSTFRIDRAEAGQRESKRPDTPFVQTFNKQVTVCWPTKLTLAPLAGDMVLESIAGLLDHSSEGSNSHVDATGTPAVGSAPWDKPC